MIANINFESNCKRIAKDIIRQSTDGDLVFDIEQDGMITIDVSKSLALDYSKYKKEYEKKINKYLNPKGTKVGCKISNGRPSYNPQWHLTFNIEFYDIDEDW